MTIASFWAPTPFTMGIFLLFCALLSVLTFLLFYHQGHAVVSAFFALVVILTCGAILKRGIISYREVAAQQVMDTEGRIEKVVRGKGGLVGAIRLAGERYQVMDAEPVSEGTRVRIAFLPRTRRIVSLERMYHV